MSLTPAPPTRLGPAAEAHQAQCDADDAAVAAAPVALTAAELRARARRYDRKAPTRETAGRPLDADCYCRRALLVWRASVPARCWGRWGGL